MWLPLAPKQQEMLGYIEAIPSGLRRFTAVAESLAGVGLILPWLTGILPWLTPLAAVGLVLIMIGAVIVHIPPKEYRILYSTWFCWHWQLSSLMSVLSLPIFRPVHTDLKNLEDGLRVAKQMPFAHN